MKSLKGVAMESVTDLTASVISLVSVSVSKKCEALVDSDIDPVSEQMETQSPSILRFS